MPPGSGHGSSITSGPPCTECRPLNPERAIPAGAFWFLAPTVSSPAPGQVCVPVRRPAPCRPIRPGVRHKGLLPPVSPFDTAAHPVPDQRVLARGSLPSPFGLTGKTSPSGHERCHGGATMPESGPCTISGPPARRQRIPHGHHPLWHQELRAVFSGRAALAKGTSLMTITMYGILSFDPFMMKEPTQQREHQLGL